MIGVIACDAAERITGKQLPNPLTQPVVDPFSKMIV